MATALAATAALGAGSVPPSVLLQVTGAPNPPTTVYASNFATVNGWSTPAGATLTPVGGGPWELDFSGSAPSTIYTASRTQTGLTVGFTYRFRINAKQYAGQISTGVTGIGDTAFVATAPTGSIVDYVFVATATSHTLRIRIQKTTPLAYPEYSIVSALVDPISGWAGTHITRTDANGTSVPVRQAATQDVAGGTMTLTDYEAALTGSVSYTVTDGLGGTATATAAALTAPGAWLTLPTTAVPATPISPTTVPLPLVLTYDEAAETNGSLHTIIGRADKVANPGPLSLRSGSLEVWFPDYATAHSVRTLLASGAVALIRQPTHPGLDLYLVASRVSIRHEDPSPALPLARFVVTIAYDEQLAT